MGSGSLGALLQVRDFNCTSASFLTLSDLLGAAETAETVAIARAIYPSSCIFGIDVNPVLHAAYILMITAGLRRWWGCQLFQVVIWDQLKWFFGLGLDSENFDLFVWKRSSHKIS